MTSELRETGPSGAEARGTIVFLHGFPFDGSMWEPQLAGLPDGWRGIAPDLRGFGANALDALPGEVSTGKRMGGGIALPAEPVLTMARLADDIAAVIDERGAGRVVVCGLSMGGYVALELWRRHPERVRALVLADTRSEADDDEGRENRLRMAQTARSAGARPIATSMLPSLLSAATRRDRPEVVIRVNDMMLGTAPETLVAALAGMAARHDMTAALPDISVPTLVLVGAEDTITPPSGARRMATAIPGATLQEIDGAGHLSNLERPEPFNRSLMEFLGRL